MLYSVPYEYIKKKVDVKITDNTVEIFYNHNRIASHRRLKGRPGQYSTVTAHMPEDHQKYLEWNGDRFRKWAEQIGINTYHAVNAILTSKCVEQQTYRSCMGLLKLAEKYSDTLLEAACKKALSYTSSPSYKSIKNILVASSKKLKSEADHALKPTESEQRDIFELLHRRRKKSSTIFCSQYEFEEWYDQLGGSDSPLADAILDRIAYDSYRINIRGIDIEHDISMREVYGLDKSLRE